jgi:tripartite-type tricarboxylate transporter receptor subunit TctC
VGRKSDDAGLTGAVQRATERPDVKERLLTLGQEFTNLNVPGYRAFVQADVARWTALVETVGRDRLVAGAQ